KTRRRPKRSASEPDSISRHAITRVYASIVHCRPLTDACSAPWIDGKATLTIVTSRPAMNTLRQHVANTTERRRAPRSARDGELIVAINTVVSQQPNCVELILAVYSRRLLPPFTPAVYSRRLFLPFTPAVSPRRFPPPFTPAVYSRRLLPPFRSVCLC